MEQHSDEYLVKALAYIFNQQNINNPAEINDTPEGNTRDGLPDYREQVGTVTISTGEIPIYLQRVPDGQGGKVFLAHPQVIQETVSVRFEDIQDANAILRLDAGVNTRNFQAYLAVAEDLNLRVVETVMDTGAIFSGPGQLVQFSERKPASTEQLSQIEATLQQWREQNRLPFPNFGDNDIADLKGTLDYPPKGSPK
jgi:hypothetical protein